MQANPPKQHAGVQDLKPVASGSSYSNQWTVSGDKKPPVDPSFEAAKYWQRVKEQGFHPKHVKPPPALKDQQAVESLDEFSEFDHQYLNFPTFQTEPPIITYDPNIVYERDQVSVVLSRCAAARLSVLRSCSCTPRASGLK